MFRSFMQYANIRNDNEARFSPLYQDDSEIEITKELTDLTQILLNYFDLQTLNNESKCLLAQFSSAFIAAETDEAEIALSNFLEKISIESKYETYLMIIDGLFDGFYITYCQARFISERDRKIERLISNVVSVIKYAKNDHDHKKLKKSSEYENLHKALLSCFDNIELSNESRQRMEEYSLTLLNGNNFKCRYALFNLLSTLSLERNHGIPIAKMRELAEHRKQGHFKETIEGLITNDYFYSHGKTKKSSVLIHLLKSGVNPFQNITDGVYESWGDGKELITIITNNINLEIIAENFSQDKSDLKYMFPELDINTLSNISIFCNILSYNKNNSICRINKNDFLLALFSEEAIGIILLIKILYAIAGTSESQIQERGAIGERERQDAEEIIVARFIHYIVEQNKNSDATIIKIILKIIFEFETTKVAVIKYGLFKDRRPLIHKNNMRFIYNYSNTTFSFEQIYPGDDIFKYLLEEIKLPDSLATLTLETKAKIYYALCYAEIRSYSNEDFQNPKLIKVMQDIDRDINTSRQIANKRKQPIKFDAIPTDNSDVYHSYRIMFFYIKVRAFNTNIMESLQLSININKYISESSSFKSLLDASQNTSDNNDHLIKLCDLILHLTKVNIRMADPEIISLTRFIESHAPCIIKLIEIMGIEAYPFIQKMCINSIAPLKRFFKNFVRLDPEFVHLLRHIYTHNKAMLQDDKLRKVWIKILQLAFLLNALINQNQLASIIPEIDSMQPNNLELWYELLSNILAKEIINQLQLSTTINTDRLIQACDGFHNITSLIQSIKSFRYNQYNKIFNEMLAADLNSRSEFIRFCTGTNEGEGSELAVALTRHNRKIISLLNESGVNVELFQNYKKILPFKHGDSADIRKHIDSTINSFIMARKSIKNAIANNEHNGLEKPKHDCKKVKSSLIHNLLSLNKEIKNLEKQLFQGYRQGYVDEINHEFAEGVKNNILKNHIINLLPRFESKLKQIKDAYITESNSPDHFIDIINHTQNLIDHWHLLINEKNKQDNEKNIKDTSYHVERWDKSKLSTLFLGNMLNCCLASNGSMFHAILERRLDLAMFMDVVIDNSTNLPVCGNWLFWGFDQANPKDVYIVANFFEINSAIAKNPPLRDCLVDHLAYFTGQSAYELGAKGFLMRPLSYGFIPDFTKFGSAIDIRIDKVGGYFNNHHYYLDATTCRSFYRYTPNNLIIKEIDTPKRITSTKPCTSAHSLFSSNAREGIRNSNDNEDNMLVEANDTSPMKCN